MTNKIKTLTQIIRIKLSIWRLKKNLHQIGIGSFDSFKGGFTEITNKLYITSFYKKRELHEKWLMVQLVNIYIIKDIYVMYLLPIKYLENLKYL